MCCILVTKDFNKKNFNNKIVYTSIKYLLGTDNLF